MKLKKLFKDLDVEIKGNREVEVMGIFSHSRFVTPSSLFIARQGKTFNGNTFIAQALEAGASAILTDIYNPFLKNVVQVIAADIGAIEAKLARRYYGDPAASLFLVGITGTNGKTTTAYLVRHLLGSCGLMGTIEYIIGKQTLSAELTTADVITNYKVLREMADQNLQSAVMEVTSHALDQNRVEGIQFDLGVFTNLSQDHLDYHGSMEAYAAAKMRLFEQVKESVINLDEGEVVSGVTGVSYAIDCHADFRGTDIEESLDGTRFNVCYHKRAYPFSTKMIGRHNVYNCLAAIAVAIRRGLRFSTLQKRLATFEGVPGRLEAIPNTRGFHLFVDFAHTDRALENVLSTFKRMKLGKIITVFGCGGERDIEKRSKMAHIVERFSDQIIVTSDNPRYEDPMQICLAISKNLTCKHAIEVERRAAIRRGISMARGGDIVLIAGRGHEPFQKIAGRLIPFDDREVAREILTEIE